jgi:hypothetical protein
MCLYIWIFFFLFIIRFFRVNLHKLIGCLLYQNGAVVQFCKNRTLYECMQKYSHFRHMLKETTPFKKHNRMSQKSVGLFKELQLLKLVYRQWNHPFKAQCLCAIRVDIKNIYSFTWLPE